jgi:hypothetical protein
MDVMTAKSAAKGETIMKTYTIDAENNISVFASPEEAAAASNTPFDTFSSQQELAELAKAWPTERLVAIWNTLPGAKAVESFKSFQAAASRIWKQIQSLGEAARPETEAAKPKAAKKGKGRAQAAKGARSKGKSGKKAAPAKNAPKAKKGAKAENGDAGPREGSKMAQAVGMLSRKNGATLNELAEKFDWKTWTVRGFIAGALKKAGFTVESFKSDKGERTYRINQ